eukprot:evm.model.NODE_1906_length_5649_cov_52.924587.2
MVQAVTEAKVDSDDYLTGVIGGKGGREEEHEEGMEVVEDGEEEEETEEGGRDMDTSSQSLAEEGKDKAKGEESAGVGVGGGRRESKRSGGDPKKPKI